MICCKECVDLLMDYLEGSLDPKIASTLEEHFQDCPPCISFLNTYKSTTQVVRASLHQDQIPELVQAKLKEFLEKNIPRKK
jgi:anti-sigma factor RsiW